MKRDNAAIRQRVLDAHDEASLLVVETAIVENSRIDFVGDSSNGEIKLEGHQSLNEDGTGSDVE